MKRFGCPKAIVKGSENFKLNRTTALAEWRRLITDPCQLKPRLRSLCDNNSVWPFTLARGKDLSGILSTS
jgi:hypothetical protein